MSENRLIFYSEIMAQCVEKAKERAGFTKSNPLVGAAVVKDDKVISFGVHEFFGGPHAEVNAINNAGESVVGADLIVTLEPCSTSNKTPACTDKIISSKIKNIFVGVFDPNKNHQGKGLLKLKEAGIGVTFGLEAEKCGLLIEDFAKSIIEKKPYVSVKNAISIDGKICSNTFDSKWITCQSSRDLVHVMRSKTGAVLTGIGTVLSDNPMLNSRSKNALRQPVRVILDTMAKTPIDSNIAKTAKDIETIIFVSENASIDNIKKLSDLNIKIITAPLNNGLLDIDFVLKTLYSYDIMNVMVEAGSNINGTFRDNDEIDKLDVFIAPKIFGGQNSMSSFGGEGVDIISNAREFASMEVSKIDKDVYISARVKDYVTDLINFPDKF